MSDYLDTAWCNTCQRMYVHHFMDNTPRHYEYRAKCRRCGTVFDPSLRRFIGNRKYQVKDISDEEIYQAIDRAKLSNDVSRLTCPPFGESVKFPYDYIDAPEKVVIRKMGKMVSQDKLDYGVSLRTAWRVKHLI